MTNLVDSILGICGLKMPTKQYTNNPQISRQITGTFDVAVCGRFTNNLVKRQFLESKMMKNVY